MVSGVGIVVLESLLAFRRLSFSTLRRLVSFLLGEEVERKHLKRLMERGFVESLGGGLMLTSKGLRVAREIVGEFLQDFAVSGLESYMLEKIEDKYFLDPYLLFYYLHPWIGYVDPLNDFDRFLVFYMLDESSRCRRDPYKKCTRFLLTPPSVMWLIKKLLGLGWMYDKTQKFFNKDFWDLYMELVVEDDPFNRIGLIERLYKNISENIGIENLLKRLLTACRYTLFLRSIIGVKSMINDGRIEFLNTTNIYDKDFMELYTKLLIYLMLLEPDKGLENTVNAMNIASAALSNQKYLTAGHRWIAGVKEFLERYYGTNALVELKRIHIKLEEKILYAEKLNRWMEHYSKYYINSLPYHQLKNLFKEIEFMLKNYGSEKLYLTWIQKTTYEENPCSSNACNNSDKHYSNSICKRIL